MSHPILVTGAAGGRQSPIGRVIAESPLEAATIFAAADRDAVLERVANNSQCQSGPGDPAFRALVSRSVPEQSTVWQTFRKGEEHYQTTDAIRTVTGRNPETVEEFFRENAGFFSGSNQEA